MDHWTNWLGERGCNCELAEPRNLRELEEVVKRSVGSGKRIRATGNGYSWSPLVQNEGGVIVSMKGLARALDEQHPEPGVLHVQTGMTIEALNELAAARGYTLLTPPLFPKPTVGGVIATGSHGMDSTVGNFCDHIRELQIVRANGSVDTVNRGSPSFLAEIVALGALGIVYSVKLEVEDQYDVYVDRRQVPVDHVLHEMDDLHKTYQFLEIFWYPLQSKMWLYLMNPTDSKPDPEAWRSRLMGAWDTVVEKTAAGQLIPQIARYMPQFTPMLGAAASRAANKVEVSIKTASEAFHHQKVYPPNWDICYAVPTTHAARAWDEVIALVNQFGRADRYPVNLAVHCRFTGKSDAWLAPNHERPTCYIEAATAWGTPRVKPFFNELESRWAAIPGARPHWGKLFSRTKKLANCYPKMKDFLATRQALDPGRVFLNRFLEEKVFQLPPR
jgi:L-gulonolactone oxidase